MDKITISEAMKDLTMILMYLSRFTDNDRFSNNDAFLSWKGYNFDVLNQLTDDDFIRQGEHPSKTKYVCLTEKGLEFAKELLKKYNIED